MATAAGRILIGSDERESAADLLGILVDAGCQVDWRSLDSISTNDLFDYTLIVLEESRTAKTGHDWCRTTRDFLGERFIPILFVIRDASPNARQACFECGADTYLLRPFAAAELVAQAKAFMRIKETHDRLSEKSAEVTRMNRRLQQAYQQIDQEIELARRIQMSLLPQTLPEVPRLRFAVHYKLCGRVGGDFYDVFRLDEDHIGFYVADAMGHGVPASLLTIFVKKGVKAKEVFGQHYRLVPPCEVLDRLNRDLIDQALSDSPFITMIYGLFNHKKGALSFSRAGHPYPLYIPRQGKPCLWQQEGSLLGVFDTRFSTQTHYVRPGDKILFYSDGLDNAQFGNRAPGAESLLACSAEHRTLPLKDLIDSLPRTLLNGANQTDDVTILGMEVCG
ncbi:MAG TPA: SpoIIE family protein phosphatase [Gemmataceae bacterium]|nr:SpoIIE family protein phosphatase [Gemmataceae bacterium]